MKAAIGLGSNLGDRLEYLRRAAKIITEEFLCDTVDSFVYESEPWGIEDQPKFLNAVICGETDWRAPAIVHYLKDLEWKLGRQQGVRNGPREIDLDLLCLGDTIHRSDGVEVPHPGIETREFVIVPLAEVWPNWVHPISCREIKTLVPKIPTIVRVDQLR